MKKSKREVVVIPRTIFPMDQQASRQLKVAAYCRVSTDEEEQLNSCANQVNYYTERILSNPKWRLAGIYTDEGISGAQAKKRPAFMKMIHLCKKGKIDLIITKSISRFSRNTQEAISIVRELKALGVAVIFEKENINTLKGGYEMIFTILCTFAQQELESISQNVSRGKRMKMKTGEVDFQYHNTYGYEKGENNEPKIIEELIPIVKRIYSMFLAGSVTERIATTLNEENIPAVGGGKWTRQRVANVLSNEKYCGDVILQKTFVDNPLTKKVKQNNGELEKYLILNNHEAFVSKEIFQQVQEEMTRRSSKPKISKNTKGAKGAYRGKYALTEILICGTCGSPYRRVVWTKRNGIKQPVWRCINRIEYGDKYCKDAPNIDEEALHEAIMKAMVKGAGENTLPMLKNEIRLALLKDAAGKVDVEMLEKRIEKLRETAMKMLTDNCLNDTMSKVEKQMESISNEMKNLQTQIDEYKVKLNSTDKFETTMTAMDQHMATANIMEYDDKLVRQAIQTIKVINENTIKIYFHNNQIITQTVENKIRKLKAE